MIDKKSLFINAVIAANILIIVCGVIAAENIRRAEAVCPPGSIIKGRVALALPECQLLLNDN